MIKKKSLAKTCARIKRAEKQLSAEGKARAQAAFQRGLSV
jgi:hypothetical protein